MLIDYEKIDKMNQLGFNANGTLKISEIKEEKLNPLPRSAKKIILKYCGYDNDKLIECKWEILPEKGIKTKEIFQVKEWVDKVVTTPNLGKRQ